VFNLSLISFRFQSTNLLRLSFNYGYCKVNRAKRKEVEAIASPTFPELNLCLDDIMP
jgi:hypothetical protein